MLASLPLAEAGALASVSFDYALMGAQAAAIARGLLEQPPTETARFQPPISVQLTLNVAVAKSLSLEVPEDELPLVRTVGLETEKKWP